MSVRSTRDKNSPVGRGGERVTAKDGAATEAMEKFNIEKASLSLGEYRGEF